MSYGKSNALIYLLTDPQRLSKFIDHMVEASHSWLDRHRKKEHIRQRIETRKGWHEAHSKVAYVKREHRVPPIHFIKDLRKY